MTLNCQNCDKIIGHNDIITKPAALMRQDGDSLRKIGAELGVTAPTVQRWFEGVTIVTPRYVTGVDGKKYKVKR